MLTFQKRVAAVALDIEVIGCRQCCRCAPSPGRYGRPACQRCHQDQTGKTGCRQATERSALQLPPPDSQTTPPLIREATGFAGGESIVRWRFTRSCPQPGSLAVPPSRAREGGRDDCQRSVGSARGRSGVVPGGGQQNCPGVTIRTARGAGWPVPWSAGAGAHRCSGRATAPGKASVVAPVTISSAYRHLILMSLLLVCRLLGGAPARRRSGRRTALPETETPETAAGSFPGEVAAAGVSVCRPRRRRHQVARRRRPP